jgi:galactokinase
MKSFAERFGGEPAVRAQAHGRVNLLGEHTDYSEGLVLPAAIPQQTSVAMRSAPSAPSVVYSANLDAESELVPGVVPQAVFARYVHGCLEEVRARCGELPELQIHVQSEVPIGVGLSSSAALEVATLRALRTLLALDIDDVEIARLGQRAEIVHAGVRCGILDQMACSLLVPGQMLYLDTRTLERSQMPLPEGAELLVVDSGVSRSLAASKYNERRDECERAAKLLGVATLRDCIDPGAAMSLPAPLDQRARHVISENARVRAAQGVDASAFGALMNASHKSLSEDYAVSTPALDVLVGLLQAETGVYGAKLTGAGFGGACVALCRADAAPRCGAQAVEAFNARGHQGRVLVPQ